jgi:hypothetical protein
MPKGRGVGGVVQRRRAAAKKAGDKRVRAYLRPSGQQGM